MAVGEIFNVRKYESNAGGIYSIRVSNDAAALSTTALGAYTDKKVRVVSSNPGRSRLAGLHARGFRLGLPTAAGATTYTSQTFAPILTKADYADPNEGDLIAYQGGQWEILKKIDEA